MIKCVAKYKIFVLYKYKGGLIMELNKCKRCGAFFVSNNYVCPNCELKDNAELFKLKSFLEENDCPNSMETLASNTGISVKNITRFLEQKDFLPFATKLNVNKNRNISIEL